MSGTVHTSNQPIELGPPIKDAEFDKLDDGAGTHQDTSLEVARGDSVIGDATDVVKGNDVDEEKTLSRRPSQTVQANDDPTPARGQTEGVQEKQIAAESRQSNALLNLPPPLPFDLKVSDLWVGVPHRGPSTWIPKVFRRKADKEDTPGEVEKKWILKSVECDCHSGEVLAILGGSGSGKTTLLNAVAHRLGGLPIEDGEVAYYAASGEADRVKLERGEVKRRLGFVRQQDFLVECLTVRETLTYAAKLRLPTTLSNEAISIIVEQTIDELGLRDAAETVVGGPLRKGISGGEKRKVAASAVKSPELTAQTSFYWMCTGDSTQCAYSGHAFTSYLLLLTLSQLARRGRTVILSIHAPRSDAFPLFDRISLLSKGQVVYSGHRRDCLGWFASLEHDLVPGVNPLDFLIDISSVDNRSAENEETSKARVKYLTDAWKNRDSDWSTFLPVTKHHLGSDTSLALVHKESRAPSNLAPGLHRAITGINSHHDDADVSSSRDEKRPGMWKQTRVLLARSHKRVYRNYILMVGLVGQGIILGVMVGVAYYQLPESPDGIQSLKNLTFQLIPQAFYLQQVFWIWKHTTDLVIFDREREDRLYDVIPYVISDFLSWLLPSILSPLCYVLLVYFIAGLREDDLAANLFTVIASTILVQFTTEGLGLLSAAATRSFALASLVGNALSLFMLLSSGFLLVDVPPYVSWIRWISPYFYSYRIVATTQFRGRTFDCPADSGANLAQCNGDNVLAGLRIDRNTNVGAYFGGLLGLVVVLYTLSCFVLWIYAAGGVKHAAEIDSRHRGKDTDVVESHMTRDKIDVELRNLSLTWQRRGKKVMSDRDKVILQDVSAVFPAGEVSAILGPSGAGKSTLLQILAGRHLNPGPFASFHLQGSLLLANQLANAVLQSNIAFVEQDDDWHLPSLTVRETLRYAAILRLPDKMPKKQKIARAETVLLMLGLKDCADLPVGGALLKGISGGEKRRLSLAVQMINDPAVLVVDEPTSGLDASIALSVMQVLRDIAATGRTVIATIHQPRSDIWQLADNVTLLAKGGLIAFTGHRSEAIPYFSSIGHPMPSEFFNPADHLLDLVSVDPRAALYDQSLERVNGLTQKWKSRQHSKESGEEERLPSEGEVVKRGEGTTSMKVAFPVVLERTWKNLWRKKDAFFNRLLQPPLLGGLFILFFQRLSRGPSGAQDRIGITIESTTALPFVGLLNAAAIFPGDRNLYLHEIKSSARYSPATFIIVYSLVELWAELLGAFGYAAIMNVGVGMQTSARIYFEYSMSIWSMLSMGESFLLIFGTFIHIEGLTVTVVSTLLSMIGQFSGVISLNVPTWLAGLSWGFPLKGSTKIQIINEAVGLIFHCSAEEIQSGSCVAQSGEQLLALFGWNDLDTAKFTGIVVATAFAWRIIAWVCLCIKVRGFR